MSFPRSLPFAIFALLGLLLTGCGEPPAPMHTEQGGDLIIHHQLDLYKLLGGSQIMFRDEAVLRFTRDPVTGELICAHDPKTQAGAERLHPFMLRPADSMPQVDYTRESHPPELPAADQAFRVVVRSRWTHEFMGPVSAETEYIVALAADGAVLFQPVREDISQLSDTSYTWVNTAKVAPLEQPAAGTGAVATADPRPAAVGEYAQEARERVEYLQQEVPALGEAWRNALIDLADE